MKTLASLLAWVAAGSLALAAPPFVAMDTCFKTAYPKSDPDLAERFDFIHAQGYAGYTWTEEDPARVAEVLRLGDARGLKMQAIYCTGVLATNGLSFGPHVAGIAAALKGSDTIIWLHLTSKAFPVSSAAGDAAAVPDLQRFADAAASNGLRVAIYPHRGDWTERFADALRVAKAVGRPNFGVTFNLCHSLMSGDEADIPRLLGEAGDRLFLVTINGADAGAPGSSWGRLIRPLDEGNYDVGIVLRRLREVGYAGAIALQGYGIRTPYREQLTRSMEAWRRLTSASREWTFDPPFSGWKQPVGDWFAAGGVSLQASNRHQLAASPGSGVGVNGPVGKTRDLVSADEFGDVELHVEFLLGEKSNSGIYVMGRYEVQIYDSFGVQKDAYPGIECGGIYPRWVGGQNVDGHAPLVNAARAPGEWQEFDISFRAPRFDAAGKKIANAAFVKVVHNGKVVQENIDLPGPTRGGYDGEAARGPLRLQGDHGPVAYRNVRLRETGALPMVKP